MERIPHRDVGVPPRPFLYTLDQIAGLVGLELSAFKQRYVYYDGRSTGVHKYNQLRARNVAPEGERPDWRVAEQEFFRWLKFNKFYVYERGWIID